MSIDTLDLEPNTNFLWPAPLLFQDSTPPTFTQTIHQIGSQWANCNGILDPERIEAFESSAQFQESQSEWMHWLLETGIWDGCEITSDTASLKQEEMEERFLDWLSNLDPSSDLYQNMVMQLAYLGGDPELKAFLEEEMSQPGFKQTGGIWHCFKKGYKKTAEFCHDHPYIAIGIAVVVAAAVVTVVVICISSAATATAVAGAAGAILGDSANDKPSPHPFSPAPIAEATPSLPEPQIAESTPPFKIPGERVFHENGIEMDGQFTSYRDILTQGKKEEFLASLREKAIVPEKPPQEKSRLDQLYEPIRPTNPAHESQNPVWSAGPSVEKTLSLPCVPPKRDYFSNPISRIYETPGNRQPHTGIGMINGINTSFEEALGHTSYLTNFAPGRSVDLIYNQSHGALGGILESVILNHSLGYSPNTARLSLDVWTKFHQDNIDHPKAKFLHFCHSQGTIHTLNALAGCPKEVRDRVIVVAIAPAAVVPEYLCFKSFNYACKNDIVHLGELVGPSALNTHEFRESKALEIVLERRKELILLEAHPDSTGLGHSFQDPTFEDIIKKHIEQYLDANGEYE